MVRTKLGDAMLETDNPNTAISIDSASEIELECSPPVKTTLLLLLTVADRRHTTDESDCQIVEAHCELPNLTVTVWCPTANKTIGASNSSIEMKDNDIESTENASVMVPGRVPTVNLIPKVPGTIQTVPHLTEVKESHKVDGHPVCPPRALAVYVAAPMPPPYTVNNADSDTG